MVIIKNINGGEKKVLPYTIAPTNKNKKNDGNKKNYNSQAPKH